MERRDVWKTPTVIAAFGMALALALTGCDDGTGNGPRHTHEWSEWALTLAPTCSTPGEETRICAINPAHVETRAVAADPDAHVWGSWDTSEGTAPTCTAAGQGTKTCDECGDSETGAIPALGRDWSEWRVPPPPAGQPTLLLNEERYCGHCAEVEEREMPLAERFAWLRANARSGGEYVVEITGDAELAPQTLPAGLTGVSIAIRGAGGERRTVSLSANGAMFAIGSGVTLELGDHVVLEGRSDSGNGDANNNAPLVVVGSGGSLVMNTTAPFELAAVVRPWIIGNTNTSMLGGGGVRVNAGGTFVMHNGQISGNSTTASLSGGGVHIAGGTFVMHTGMIRDNTAAATAGDGGGVFVDMNGMFDMRHGMIHGNSARNGGGVFVDMNGTFNMHNGQISTGNSARISGGGVNVALGGTFRAQSGGIFGNASGTMSNTASSSGASLFANAMATSQHGTFGAGGVFSRTGDLTTSNEFLFLMDGALTIAPFAMPLAD